MATKSKTGLSREALAEKLGVATCTLKKYEAKEGWGQVDGDIRAMKKFIADNQKANGKAKKSPTELAVQNLRLKNRKLSIEIEKLEESLQRAREEARRELIETLSDEMRTLFAGLRKIYTTLPAKWARPLQEQIADLEGKLCSPKK